MIVIETCDEKVATIITYFLTKALGSYYDVNSLEMYEKALKYYFLIFSVQ